MEQIILHVYYTGRPEAVRAFLADIQAQGLQKAVQAEDGCLQYDYVLSCRQDGEALLLEKWRDAAALERHQAQPHMAGIRQAKARHGLESRLERYG